MRIKEGRVLVIGAGGLGSPILMYLAAAGTGVIGVADGDIVDISNLQRQVIHTTADFSYADSLVFTHDAAHCALDALRAEGYKAFFLGIGAGKQSKDNLYREYLTTEKTMDVIKEYDFVIDATDNYESKLLINDVCVAAGKPFSHGAVLRFQGHTFTWQPGHASYRCMFGAERSHRAPKPACSAPFPESSA